MGVISRYFQRLAAIVRPKRTADPEVSADCEGLRIGDELIAWSELCRLSAYKRDIYLGDLLCLSVLASGGRMFEITEESPGWKAAGEAIERFLPESLPQAEWTLRLIAANPSDSVEIYSVTIAR
jgi:hypothetical protein